MPKPKKRGRGQPTKYLPKYCHDIIKYFDVPHFEDKEVARVTGKNDYEKTEYKEIANPIRFLTRFASDIGVTLKTLENWASDYPDFLRAYTRAKELQLEMMVSNGAKGLYNPYFTTFMMKNMHGWKEESVVVDNSQHYHCTLEQIRARRNAKKESSPKVQETINRLERPRYGTIPLSV
jgi:hypothetical protein